LPALRRQESHHVDECDPERATYAASKANPSLPAGFDAIIDRALVKDREKRFQHAAEICSDLKRLKRETGKRT